MLCCRETKEITCFMTRTTNRFIETLFAKKEETGFLVYAYCLMDNIQNVKKSSLLTPLY